MKTVQDVVRETTAVVFDLFHTLTAIESSWGQGLPFTSALLGVDTDAWLDQLHLHSRERLTGEEQDPVRIVRDLARAIDPAIPDAAIEAAVANRIRRFAAAVTDVPEETTTVLRDLKSSGKKLGLISNADVMEVAAWDESPLAALFDVVVLSCEVGLVKPERAIYGLCLRRLGVAADEAIFVGDGGSDELRGARDVGMTTVMITGVIATLWPEKVEPRKKHADFVIEWLRELVA